MVGQPDLYASVDLAWRKPAYVKPIHMLVASSSRVSEQIKGRLLFVHTETLKSGVEKTIAVMADKDQQFALKSVLVQETWSPADQNPCGNT